MARVLLAKPGLDGHDRGLHVVARALRDSGHEVILTGTLCAPDTIADIAVQEDVAVVGLSMLAGGHVGLTEDVVRHLEERGAECRVVVGGTVPDRDVAALTQLGVAAVFPVGSRVSDIVAWFAQIVEDE